MYDCNWRRYIPQDPLYRWTFYDQHDRIIDYSPWNCKSTKLETRDDEPGNSEGDGGDSILPEFDEKLGEDDV